MNRAGYAGGFDTKNGADSLIELVRALPARYRRNGDFLMNRTTLSAVRWLNTGDDGSYLFQTSIAEGFRMSLMGFPITGCDEMPVISAGSSSIAFGGLPLGLSDRGLPGVCRLSCVIPIPPSPTSYSTPPSALAAASPTSTPSAC